MEDFNKIEKQISLTMNEASSNLLVDAANKYKKGFFESRLNKDNFWNLIFWFILSIGFTTALAIKSNFPEHGYGLAFCCATIIVAVLILKITCKTNFDTLHRFTNSEGISLNNNLPTGWFIIFTVAGIFLTGYVADTFATGEKTILKSFLVFFGFCSGFCIYFILINCPISLLFSSSFWKENNKNYQSSDFNYSSSQGSAFTSTSQFDYQNNLRYSDRPENTNFKRHWYYK